MRRGKKRHSFTFIEIMVVVIILGIMATVVATKLTGRTEEARETAAATQIDNFSTAIDAYEMDNGEFPKALSDLIKKPAGLDSWKGPYLQKGEFKDPWGKSYHYLVPGKNNPKSYDLWSEGKTAEDSDDITNWE